MGSVNNSVGSKRNVAHHYDIGNDLYRLMLDPEHMQYSCAYWDDGTETLGAAQEAKLAHIAAKLALSGGQNVLDIGCGWGGMAIISRGISTCVFSASLFQKNNWLLRGIGHRPPVSRIGLPSN